MQPNKTKKPYMTFKQFRDHYNGRIDSHIKEDDKTSFSRDIDSARDNRWEKSEWYKQMEVEQFTPDRWQLFKPDNEMYQQIYPVEANMLSINNYIKQAKTGEPSNDELIEQTEEMGSGQLANLRQYLIQLVNIAYNSDIIKTPPYQITFDYNGGTFNITSLPDSALLEMIHDISNKIKEGSVQQKLSAINFNLTEVRQPNFSKEVTDKVDDILSEVEKFYQRQKKKMPGAKVHVETETDVLDTSKSDRKDSPEQKENETGHDDYPPADDLIPADNQLGLSPSEVGVYQRYMFGL